jgi:hypothetical protein
MRNTWTWALVVLMMGAGCKRAHSTGAARTDLPAGYKEVTGPGWSYGVPDDWAPAPTSPTVYRAAAPTGDFYTNINMTTEPFGGDSDSYAKANVKSIGQLTKATIVGQHPVHVGTTDAVQLDSLYPMTPPYRTIQWMVAKGGTGYVLTCSVAASKLDQEKAKCDVILKSLRLDD